MFWLFHPSFLFLKEYLNILGKMLSSLPIRASDLKKSCSYSLSKLSLKLFREYWLPNSSFVTIHLAAWAVLALKYQPMFYYLR